VKHVDVPHLGRSIKLGGRTRPAHRVRLHLRDYLRHAALPAPPAEVDYSALAASALAQVYLNDQLGDCVVAGLMHLQGVWTGNANGGAPFIATPDQVVAAYGAIGGYKAGDESTDQGCDEQTALNYAQQTGVGDGVKFAGWCAVDGTNPEEIKQAVSLFEGGLMFGIALPDAWINPFPSAPGFVWDAAGDPDPNNGHAIVGAGFNDRGVLVSTWGLSGDGSQGCGRASGIVTWAAVAKYATQSGGGELYVALSPDQIANGQAKTPNGIAWDELVADFRALAGQQPAPANAPAPTPAAMLSLADAQTALAAGWPQSA
jgi:hypothetical protein